MKTVMAVLVLVATMLAGAFSIHNIWEWFSLVSEGRAGEANLQALLLSLVGLVIVIGLSVKVVDWVSEAQPHGGR